MKPSLRFIIPCLLLMITLFGKAQQVGIGTTTPNVSAKLEISSTNSGFLPPRMTAVQRIAISTPAEGLLVYQTDDSKGYYYYTGGAWSSLRDEKTYTRLTIGTQQWMDKNLDVTTYRNGDIIPYIPDSAAWIGAGTGAWCYYNNDPSTNAAYGKLYNGAAVKDPRGLAPIGWHIPSNSEWTVMETFLGAQAGAKLKVRGTNAWTSPNTGATNSSGWSGLPGGYRSVMGVSDFAGIGTNGYWWSSTESGSGFIYLRNLSYGSTALTSYLYLQEHGFSVRCIKD